MTQPTHGLDPKALEATRERAQAALDSARATGPNSTSQTALEYRLAECIDVIAALSQNPGTSNTSGEAGPVAWRWRFPPGGWHYASEKPEFAPYDAERVHGPFPMYATLEPRASDREAVIEEIENAMLWFAHPLTDRKVLRFKAEQTAAAIRKLSEVSHEH